MSTLPELYRSAAPLAAPTVADTPAVPTAVVRNTDYPMHEMPALMDGTFAHLPVALAEAGITPIGPALSLHTRMPTDTADLEVGFPVDAPLTEPITLPNGFVVVASELPAGRAIGTSYVGGYEGLGDAWGGFMQAVAESGETAALPFWEMYVTEPSPEADPATMRTDLFTALESS